MRTTVNIEDHLLVAARKRAMERKMPLSRMIEDALRASLTRPGSGPEPVRLVTAGRGGVKPGVDLDNSRVLLEIMDGQP